MSNGNGVRTFEDSEAERVRVPLILGIVGPSGSGKTYSALRLAAGIQRVVGGDIHAVDSEARRMLHYAPRKGEPLSAGKFRFRHTPFRAPFSPLDYLAAIDHCVKKGAKIIIVDSASHEHEGPGGVLEQHQEEMERLAALWGTSLDAANMPAWNKPKTQRRQLINAVTQMDVHFIFCFRAKRKVRIVKGSKPESRGWMPIAGEEFIYDMTAKFLLYPGSDGVPVWSPDEADEKEMFKMPGQFRDLFAKEAPLSEDIGQKMAEWAQGGPMPVDDTIAKLRGQWLAFWEKKGVSPARILAALGKETVEDLRDFKPFDAMVGELKAKKKHILELFPEINPAPPTDDDDTPPASSTPTAASNGATAVQATLPGTVSEDPDDAAARAAAAPGPDEFPTDDSTWDEKQ